MKELNGAYGRRDRASNCTAFGLVGAVWIARLPLLPRDGEGEEAEKHERSTGKREAGIKQGKEVWSGGWKGLSGASKETRETAMGETREEKGRLYLLIHGVTVKPHAEGC